MVVPSPRSSKWRKQPSKYPLFWVCLVPLPIFTIFYLSHLGRLTAPPPTKTDDVDAAVTLAHMKKQSWSIPQGSAPNLPSNHKEPPSTTQTTTLSPAVWRGMISNFNVKTLIDVTSTEQCLTTLWFLLHGVNAKCVHSSTPSTKSLLAQASDKQSLVEHDYTQGPWWPERTHDAVWATDLLDRVPIHLHNNVISTFRKAAIIIISGGNKNSNHDATWWSRKFKSYGFLPNIALSDQVQKWAASEVSSGTIPVPSAALKETAQVFINPSVASLPWHSHLLFEHGCFAHRVPNAPAATRPCGDKPEESVLPKSFLPLEANIPKAQQQWEGIAQKTIANTIQGSTDLVLPSTPTADGPDYLTPFELPTGLDASKPLSIPRGGATNLPSVRVQSEAGDKNRKFYGGKGDKQHLGGFIDIDPAGISTKTWKNMIEEVGIKSIMDIGCGRGISSLWFHLHGLDTLCVEGSHDAVEQSVLPKIPEKPLIVEHDFSRGPYWPEKTYDAVWCVEFLEHVGVNFHFNYITTMRKAAVLFVTSSARGGWHHVEVHPDSWWIQKFESYGFLYHEELTTKARQWASSDHSMSELFNQKLSRPQHVYFTVKVFVNPAVAALPQHAHVLYEAGCMLGGRRADGVMLHRQCNQTGESPLPESHLPLKIDPMSQQKWVDELGVRTNINKKE